MGSLDFDSTISRRRALAVGGGALAGLLAAYDVFGPLAGASAATAAATEVAAPIAQGAAGSLPVEAMERALEAKGTVTAGVLHVGIDRTDIGTISHRGVPVKPSFEVNGDVCFQPLSGGRVAFFNGDMCVKPQEIEPVIDAIVANGLVLQALHQHFYDFDPMVWFIHLRGLGEPVELAKRVRNVFRPTSTPFPQTPPAAPTTPLDKERLRRILHGYEADVGSDGVVTIFVARNNPIFIDGIRVMPQTNIATNVAFEPLDRSGSKVAVVPDFGMEAHEVDDVMRVMRPLGWDVGCLYNQETAEHPQLFFSHQFKSGDPYRLAVEVRRGLDRTNTQ